MLFHLNYIFAPTLFERSFFHAYFCSFFLSLLQTNYHHQHLLHCHHSFRLCQQWIFPNLPFFSFLADYPLLPPHFHHFDASFFSIFFLFFSFFCPFSFCFFPI